VDTPSLARLIDQKHDLLAHLVTLARRQLGLIHAGEMSPLLAVLSAKQTLLEQLQVIERQIDPYRDQDPETRRWPTPAHRQRCADAAGQCGTMLAELIELERQGEAELVRRRNEATQRLQEMRGAAEARGAYSAGSPVRHARLDLASET
jgi:flagellar biosynthesis/type III secretory pathway chaperone